MKEYRIVKLLISMLILVSVSFSVQKTFSQGSLIIPMDPCWQPNRDPAVDPQFVHPNVNPNGTANWCDSDANDNAVFHAYGLVYELLQEKIPVYWIINPNKTDRNDIDFTINGGTQAPVTKLNDNSPIDPPQRTINGTTLGDHVIDYRGGPFVIDAKDLPQNTNDKVWQIINKWMVTVKIHKANVSFTAPVDKVLNKTPPRIAVLGQGATNVLIDYLTAMGLGNRTTTVYDVLSPQDIAKGLIFDYQLFWAPHWEIEKEIEDPDLRASVLSNLRTFLEQGNAAFLECASIESIEGAFDVSKKANGVGNNQQTQDYGGWLTDKNYTVPRIESNGGSMQYNYLVFEFPSFYLPQCAGWIFEPKGGHIENLRPNQNIPYQYNHTVQRYVHDRDGAWNNYDPGFDYFVGGRINGSPTQGFVAYLAGHKYIQCSVNQTNTSGLTLNIEFNINFSGRLEIEVIHSRCTQGNDCPKGYYDHSNKTFQNDRDDFVELKFDDVSVNGKKVSTIYVNNVSNTDVTVSEIVISWDNNSIKLEKVKDEGTELCNPKGTTSPYTCNVNKTLSPSSSTSITYCYPDWGKSNTCGIRFVLNTIFGLQFEIISNEYVVSSPVVDEGIMYIGSYEFPGHKGHLRAYDLSSAPAKELWDALDAVPDAGSSNPATPSKTNTSRYIFTAIPGNNGMQLVDFEDTSASILQNYLDPSGNSTLDDIKALINTVRGRYGASPSNPSGIRETNYKLWGIEFSTPAVIKGTPLISGQENRDRIVIVGANDGMLHAFYAGSKDPNTGKYTVGDGTEIWAYIPSTLLPYLKDQPFNDYNKSNVVSVSGSPAVGDFFVDIDGDGVKEWRTLLVGTATVDSLNQGIIFAMDVTDPYNPKVLWEKTFPTENMGKSKGPAIGHIYKDNDVKTWVFITTNFADKEPDANGSYGIKAFALDILTGKVEWKFSSSYEGKAVNINEIPHIPSLMDYNNDGMIDFVVFGDMQGRLWMLDAKTGKSISSDGGPIFKTYTTGNEGTEPIAGGVSIYNDWLIFGTGGANFTSDQNTYHLYALKVSPSGDIIQKFVYDLQKGEKVWNAPIVDKYGNIFFGASIGYKSLKPDKQGALNTSGRIVALSLSGNGLQEVKSVSTNSAQIGDVALAEGVVVGISFTGEAVQIGKYQGGSSGVVGLPVKIFNWKIR